jgi:taurine dioxygenase
MPGVPSSTKKVMPAIDITPVTGTIGAEVGGVDPASELDDDVVESIRAALVRHLVLIFRDVDLTPERQVAFARRFGPVHPPPLPTRFGMAPEINVLDQTSGQGNADRWHNDNTYLAEPPKGSVLHVVKVPSVGGDTAFASMYAAYDALSPHLRDLIDNLHAEHDISRSLRKAIARGQTALSLQATQERFPPVVHPVAITHPDTGRRALFVNPQSTTRIVELCDAESDMLLALLYGHVKSPEFQCRVRWDERTVVLVDNLCVQHCAVADYHDRRILHRVSIKGFEAPAADAGTG